MKILSWNVNGIRSVFNKGFLDWFNKVKADIVCLQEIKAQEEQIPVELFNLKNYHLYSNQAIRKGYSGVAVFTKQKPIKVDNTLGFKRFDQEGRILKLKYPNFTLINLYLPHGGRDKENLEYKLEAYGHLINYLKRKKNQNIVLTGDFNIAHQEIDLARFKSNKNNIMFTSEERKQIDRLISLGFIDSFRKFNKETGNYSWWPYAHNARQRNIGWRIDYAFVSEKLKSKDAFILKNALGSDHCPIGVEL